MLQSIQALIITLTLTAFTFADVLMTELTDPQNSSDAGRYVELYNNGNSDVDLSTGWKIQRWTNGNADPTASSIKDLTGTIAAGGFYIICNDADKFSATYGLTCDQDIGTGGAADSNGDDNMAILDADGAIADMFGVAGEDGTGTGHEFEDGRAERDEGVTAANATWDETEWNIDNDSGGGDGNQYAPEGFDPGAWIGATGGGGDTCEDESACNTGADGACEYPDTGYDCDGNCVGEVDCAGVCGGVAVEDCDGDCGGGAVNDACGVCGGDGSSCSVNVTFSVDMSIEGVIGDIKLRTSTVNGDYSPSDWYTMTDDGNGTYSHTLSLLSGVEYGYNFNNSDGSGYESGDGLGDCAGGNYGNDRFVTPGDSDITLDTVCWESCEACPEEIPGCMDETALNYDENATVDDGSCIYDWPEAANLFLSEYAEGSSNNKYLEIYNATEGDVDLSGYSLSSCSNGCDDGVSWDYPDNVTFELGTTVSAGDVFVVCHGSADDIIQAECDQTFTYLSNGDDVFGLTQVGSGEILDIIGTIGDDPGSGWAVGDDSNGTQNQTLVRKSSVQSGNAGDWASSAGTNADDSEWVVLDQNTWDYLGSHPHDISLDCAGTPNGDAVIDECGVCGGDGATYECGCSDIADGACDCDGNVEDIFGICGGGGSLQGAIDAAVNGATINIPAGTYTGALSIDEGISLNCAEGAMIDASGFNGAINISANNVTVDGCEINGDGATVYGIVVTPGSDNIMLLNNKIHGMSLANPANDSPLSYGILVYGDSTPPDPPENITISGNEIYGVSGSGISLGSMTSNVSITNNAIHDIVPVVFNGEYLSVGVQAELAGNVSVAYNAFSNLIVGTNLIASSGIVENNTYNTVVLLHVTTLPPVVSFSTDAFWAYVETTLEYGGYTISFGIYASSVEIAVTLAADGTTITTSTDNIIIQDCAGTWGGDMVADECGECGGDGSSCACIMGDVNDDGAVNVLDIVQIVGYIISGEASFDLACADINGDGALNVLDIVALVNDVVGGGRIDDATSARLIKSANGLVLQANGYIGGVQMTLKHGSDFKIELTDNAFVADYKTVGTETILVIVVPEGEELFTFAGDFEIVDMIVANSSDRVNVTAPTEFSLSEAYPNPFNPSTTVELTVPEAGHVSVMVYNITGQLVAELADSYMDANQYQFTWQGENVPSGMYLLRAEYAGQVSTQKLMLLK